MTVTIPDECDCGGTMRTGYYYVGDFGGSPAYEPQDSRCSQCGRLEERVVEEHEYKECEIENCGWCLIVLEEFDITESEKSAIRARMSDED